MNNAAMDVFIESGGSKPRFARERKGKNSGPNGRKREQNLTPLPKGEGGPKGRVKGKEWADEKRELHPSPATHLAMVGTLSLRERDAFAVRQPTLSFLPT